MNQTIVISFRDQKEDGIDANKSLNGVSTAIKCRTHGREAIIAIFYVQGVVSFTRKFLFKDMTLVSVERLDIYSLQGVISAYISGAQLGKTCTD